MASDLDTVRVLRALFNDIPRAPQGLSHEATMAWIERSMTDFPGGEVAYMIEHVTRNSMVDIVLRLREDGYLKDDQQFDQTLQQIATPEGRKTFMDWCINAQKSVDATARLLTRAKRAWSEPEPLFVADAAAVQRFINGRPTGPGVLFAEFAMRDDVREIGLFETEPGAIHEFDWASSPKTPASGTSTSPRSGGAARSASSTACSAPGGWKPRTGCPKASGARRTCPPV